MAVHAATLIRQYKSIREQSTQTPKGEPVSFHLALLLGGDFELPDGKTSVDVLRSPFTSNANAEESAGLSQSSKCFGINHKLFRGKATNPAGTKMQLWTKKFNTSNSKCNEFDKAWQDRLLIVAEKRIFIVTRKLNTACDHTFRHSIDSVDRAGGSPGSPGNADLEIVDSIPVEEIASISIEGTPGEWDGDKPKTDASFLVKTVRRAASVITSIDRRSKRDNVCPATEEERTAERLAMERQLLRNSIPSHLDGFCEPILRISTRPEGFNRGQSYYFLLRAQDFPCLDESAPVPLRTHADADALAARLTAAVARRRGEHARETRFLRLQELQARERERQR
jgi:hypothetical protein